MIVRENIVTKDCFGETPKPTRETRALPRRTAFHAFTLIELLIVMAIILVLAGLILATSNYVQKKGYRSRAEAEIAAISAALENYKADNGVYPSAAETNALKANTMGDPTNANYISASLALYKLISGDADADRTPESKSYFNFKPNQLAAVNPTSPVLYIKDPFGNSYGYSTVKASAPSGNDGYNPTFDLWSTAGATDATNPPDQSQWIKNW
jgi:prepilin-type N-terminal cleavage/methylation domain-containing protein